MKVSTPGRRMRPALLLLSLSAALLIFGITVDEPDRVLAQAVQVCFSCIGIG